MTLYELDETLQRLIWWLEEDPENEAIKETISMLLLDLEDKADGYFAVIRQLHADAEAIKAEKLRLAARQKACEKGEERMREALKHAMQITGRQKIKTARCTMSLTTRWKAFLDADPDQIPKVFQKVTIEADTQAIEKWLKEDQGKNCAECDWAHLEQVESLMIR